MTDRISDEDRDDSVQAASETQPQDTDRTDAWHMPLEPRLVFDAALGAELVDATVDAVTDEAPTDTDVPEDVHASVAGVENGVTVVVIDAGVEDAASLADDLPADAVVITLDASDDGLTSIADALSGLGPVSDLHILSHGEAGRIQLGAEIVDTGALTEAQTAALSSIGEALTADGDILIYGCDFGADADGLDTLAALTGADIAASDDLTGAAALGGDWELEATRGTIEADTVESADYRHTLADFTDTGTSTNYTLNGTDTLTIESGTYTGTINGLAAGAEIIVKAGAAFEPSSINNPSGKITIEDGATAVFPGLAMNTGFEIENSGDARFGGNLNFNGTVDITNTATGVMTFVNTLPLGNGSTMTNDGEMNFQQDLNTRNGSTLNNTGDINLTSFNPNGVVVNDGYVKATQFININGQSEVTNNCGFEARAGFNNNSNDMVNNGYIFITNDGATWQNNATYTQGPDGVVTGFNFTNNATISGGGSFYFEGFTRNQGPFGNDGDGETINFFDVSQTGMQIFDSQSTAPIDTVRMAFTPPPVGSCPTKVDNQAPVAVDDTVVMSNTDTEVALDLLGNDTDADGDALTVASVAGVAITPGTAQDIPVTGGVVRSDGAGNLTFERTAGVRVASFDYTVDDGSGTTDTGSVTVNVDTTIDLSTDRFSTLENNPVSINVLANDGNSTGDSPTTAALSDIPAASEGVLTYVRDGIEVTVDPASPPRDLPVSVLSTLVFTPATSFFTLAGAPVEFTYTVTDVDGDTASTTVGIDVAPVNDAPVVDLNSAADPADADRGNVVEFTEAGLTPGGATTPGTPVALVGPTGSVSSVGENDIVVLSIDVPDNPEGPDEVISLDGTDFPLNEAAAGVLTVTEGASSFDVRYDGFTFTIVAAGEDPATTTTPMDDDDLSAVIRRLTYVNNADAAEDGARTFEFIATDTNGTNSTAAVASVNIIASNDAPQINIDPDNLSLGVDDAGFEQLIAQGQSGVSIIGPNGGVISTDGDDLEQVTITPGGILDGSDETLTFFGTDGSTLEIPLDGSATSGVVNVNGTDFNIAYDGTDIIITVVGGGPAETDTINDLLTAAEYENANADGSLGERTFDIFVEDSQLTSPTVRSVVELNLEPFLCTGQGYTFSRGSTETVTTISVVTPNPTTGELSLEDPVEMDITVNGVGFNIQDGYGYGVATGVSGTSIVNKSIVRIGSDGKVVDLGTPVNTDPTGREWSRTSALNSGAIGDDGTYYTRTGGRTISILSPPQGASKGDLTFTDLTTETATGGRGATVPIDIAFGQDGALYGLSGGNIVRIEIVRDASGTPIRAVTSTIPLTGTGNADIEGGYGGAWSDAAGRLFFFNNGGAGSDGTRDIVRIDLNYDTSDGVNVNAPANATATNVGNAESLPTFDAFACRGFDRGDAPGYDEATHNLDPLGIYLGTTLTDGEVAGNQNVSAQADEVSGIADEDGYSGITVLPVRDGETFTIPSSDLTFTNINDVSGAKVHVWIDWDADGVFETGTGVDYASADIVQNAAGDWVADTDLSFVVPASVDVNSDQTYMRIRVSTDTRIDNTTPADLDPSTSPVLSTAAVDGDVEDYRIFLNTPPTLAPDVGATLEDVRLNVNRRDGLLSNDTDTNPIDRIFVSGLSADLNGDGSQQSFTVGKATTISDASGEVGTILIRQNGSYVFTPAANYFGDVPQITYTVSDTRGVVSSSTLDIVVDGVPDVATDRLTTPEEAPILIDALSNDFDRTGDGPANVELSDLPPLTQGTLSYTDASGTEFSFDPATPPFRLTIDEFETLTFTPAEGFTGKVDPFTYTLTDTDGTPGTPGDDDTASARIEITVSDTPEPVDDDFVVAEDTTLPLPLQTNDDTGDGLLSVSLGVFGDVGSLPAASEGVLTFVRGGARVTAVPGEVLSQAELSTLQFEPAADFSGPVTPFVYTLTGTNGGVSDPATVTITVDGVPDLADDTVTVQEDVATALSPLDNDPDVVGDGPATLALTSAPPAGQGELSYTDAGGATVVVDPTALPSGLTAAEFNTLTFTPAPDYTGPVDPVTYTVTDADGDVESATIRIAIDAAPDAGDDTIAATEDTPVAVDVLGNDEGGDGLAGVTFAAVPDPAVGTLTYTDASGASQPVVAGVELTPAEAASLLFTPAPDVSGPVPPFTYTLRDVDGDVSAPATVSITVDGIPDLADDLVSIAEDETVLLDPLANDADPVGDGPASVAITAIPAPGEGTLSYTADAGGTVTIGAGALPAGLSATEAATLTFTPAPAYNGPVTPITYTVTDADGDVERATIRVEIAATVDAVNDAVTTPEGSPVALAPLANDDPGGPGASVTIDTAPPASQGTLTYVDATGTLQTVDPAVLPATLTPAEFNTLTFTPAADYQGPVDPIGYTITDPDGGARDSAAISILVDGLPEAVDDVVAGEEDTPLALDIVANDDLGDGVAAFTLDSLPPAAEGLLTYVDATTGAVTPVTAGAPLTPAEAATLTFTPAADFNGPVTDIPYTLTDADGDTSSATLSISIDAAPDAVADLVETPEDTQAAIPLLDNDGFDAADLATVTVTAPAAGFGALTYTDATGSSVTLTPGAATDLTPGEAATLAFAPAPDVTGAVPAIPYTLTDLDGDSSDALISILIVPTPDAVPETIATDEETPVALDLTSNDDTGAGLDSIRLDTVPPATEGTLTYTDAAGTLQTVDPASPPTLTPAEAASLVFTPAPDFSGTATPIGYTLFDTNGAADSSQAVITVNGVPDLTDDIFSTPSDTSIDLDILANDVDFGDGIDTVTLDALPPAAEGVLTYETVPGDASTRTDAVAGTPLTAAQADTLAFDPDPAFFGAVTPVTYTVTDTTGDSATATLSGSVAADVNAATDSYLTDPDLVITEGTTQPLGLLANDRFNDPDSTVTLAGLPPASEGTLTYTDAAGTVIAIDPAAPPVLTPGEAATLAFTPADGFGGAVTPFTYTITAPDGTTDSAAVELFVDLLPEARPDSFAIEEGGTADLSTLISGGTEEDDRGDGPVTLAITAPPAAQGTLSYETVPGDATTRTDIPAGATEAGLTEAQAATLAFAATPEFAGPVDPIAYTITDADGDSSATTVSIAVDPAPDATSEAVTVAEDTPTPIDIFANETDPGSGLAAVTFTGIPDPATVGILTVLDDPTDPASARPLTEGDVLTPAQAATLTFVPVENFDGAVPPVSYTLTDTDGDVSDPATLTLTVDAAPEALPDLFTVDEDGGPVAINPLANDDGDPGTPQGDTGSPGPNTPTVTLTAPAAAQGTLTYTADAGGTVTAAPGAPLTLSATEAQSLAFTPAPDFDGTVAIDYTVTDGDAADPERASATLRIAVNPIPDPVADLVATDEDTPVALGILPGDDVGDGIATVDILSLPDPADGTLTYTDATGATQTLTAPASLSAAEANTLTFTPAPDVTTAGRPPVSFTYTLTDTTADTATPTPVNITIEAQSDVADDLVEGLDPGPQTFDPLANDESVTGDPLDPTTVRFVNAPIGSTLSPDGKTLIVPGQGTWRVDPATGAVTFTPESGFTGDPAPVDYTVQDSDGDLFGPATIAFDYRPVATPDEVTFALGEPVVIDVLANDTTGDAPDPATVQLEGTANPGDPLEIPGVGTWSIDPATGAITFTPVPGNTEAPPLVSYTVADSSGLRSDPATITVTYTISSGGIDLPDRKEDIRVPQSILDPRGLSGLQAELPTFDVAPIVDVTANTIKDLGSYPALQAFRPILSAINSVTDLNGVSVLPTQDLDYFAQVAAPYPITIAVENVDPGEFLSALAKLSYDLFEQIRQFFPEGFTGQRIYFLVGYDNLLILSSAIGSEGAVIQVTGAGTDGEIAPLETAVFGAEGRILPEGVTGDRPGVVEVAANGAVDRALHLVATLPNGDTLEARLTLDFAGEAVTAQILSAGETSSLSSHLDTIANAQDDEIASLAKALMF